MKPNLYSYSELKAGTQEFHPNNEMGRGGFGVVYKVGINSSLDSLTIPTQKGNISFVRYIHDLNQFEIDHLHSSFLLKIVMMMM